MEKRVNLLVQGAFWVALWLIINISTYTESRPAGFYWVSSLRILLFAVYFNVTYFFVLPIYFKGKRLNFFLLSILAFSIFVLLQYLIDRFIFEPQMLRLPQSMVLPKGFVPLQGLERPRLFMIIPSAIIGIAIFGLSAAAHAFAEFEKNKKSTEEANRRRLEAEIALLKSQINPHFLLNTFNNLYSLSITNPELSPVALLKVSDMMKYILYECSKPRVSLGDDLAFIENYLHLQELRLPANVHLHYHLPSAVPAQIQIEPMILIPFIENAFKHGISTRNNCDIKIEITLEDQQLAVMVENDDFQRSSFNNSESGMGIENTTKRLQHVYEGKHELSQNLEKGRFQVMLQIDLS